MRSSPSLWRARILAALRQPDQAIAALQQAFHEGYRGWGRNRRYSDDRLHVLGPEFNFIRNDRDLTVPQSAREQTVIEAIRRDPWLLLCGDAATGAKHFKLTQRVPTADKVSVMSGWGVGRFGKGTFGVGEEHITVHLPDGTVYGALELVAGVLRSWEAFFNHHGIAQ
jgi:hypothetical protein